MKNVVAILFLGLSVLWAGATDLPLRQVTLFTSGVGYFEHQHSVSGAQEVEWRFREDQINDVIKTLIVVDESGGQVQAVTYDARDPLARTLASFAVDIGDNPALGTLLNRMRGVPVRVTVSAREWEGRILGVEAQTRREREVTWQEDVLNLWVGGATRAVDLTDVQQIEILDEALSSDLDAALLALSGSLDRSSKALRIAFDDSGSRHVRVGYLLETPLWKTSYRMILRDEEALLQGWSHVENVTDADWNDVRVSLVSGRPLSFIQNLYDPIFIQRPVVEWETETPASPLVMEGLFSGRAEAGVAPQRRMRAAAPMAMAMEMDTVNDFGGQKALATAEATGELFQYMVELPVTIPRQSSAMLPIVQTAVPATTLSIYNEQTNARHPLNGLEFVNEGDLFLMQGPVALFEGGIYAGDARMPDTQPGETRLLGYAIDLATEVTKDVSRPSDRVVQVSLVNGILNVRQSLVQGVTYRIRSERDDARSLILEHPYRANWTLQEPEGEVERSASHYRFRIELEPRATTEWYVEEERLERSTFQLAQLGADRIEFYLRQRVLSPAMRRALEELTSRREKLVELEQARRNLEQSIAEITTEQGRIRENMRVVQRGSDSFSMWERKLIEQERELERLNRSLRAAREAEQKARIDLGEWINQLTIE